MKNILKLSLGLAGAMVLSPLFSPAVRATDLLDDPADVITSANPTQQGRLSRNGAQQTWDPGTSGEAAYPGAINPTATYNFATYTFSAAMLGNGPYVEIEIEEPLAADLFVSAWTTFNGTASVANGTGWLGDAGQSEDYAFTSIPPTPQDPRFFQVTVPTGSDLTLVVNTTNAAALGESYGLFVQNYADTEYTDAVPAPEPSTWAMLGAGAVVGGVAMVRRRRAVV